jgi:anaerobic ribonucleoside-triphosphate reductase
MNTKVCKIDTEAQKVKPCYATVPGTATCPECGKPMCPVCHRHKVEQLSRVTGYISTVSGWNEAKKQEFKDRKHYDIQRK